MSDANEGERRRKILDAAFQTFSAYGVAKTSMGDIAAAASMSRPGLYQYFDDKEHILVEVLVRALGEAADAAIAELDGPGELGEQLDAFLQRWFGDLAEQLRSTSHGADLIEAKSGRAKPTVDAITARVRRAAGRRLRAAGAPHLVDLLMLSPGGLKLDAPTTSTYRKRLTALADALAASVDQVS